MTVQTDLHSGAVHTTIVDVTTIPVNFHHVYPTTNEGPEAVPTLHAPAYIAALWSGQISVWPLCKPFGSASRAITTEAKREGYTPCPACLEVLARG